MLTKRIVILGKIESSYQTDAAPVPGTDAILVENPKWSNTGLSMIDRPAVRPSLAALQQVYGGRLVNLTCDVEVKGSGTAGTAPEIGALYRMCGMGETIVPATSVTYAPVSDPASHESGTIYIYEDGKLIKLTGCRGDFDHKFESGKKIVSSFTITGHVSAQTDVALPSPTLDTTLPIPFNAASFAIGGYSAVISKIDFGMGWKVATPPSVNSADGFGEIMLTERDVNGNIDPQDTLVATKDWLGEFTAGTLMAMATGTLGSTAGNRVAFSWPQVYYRDASPDDRDGVRAVGLPVGMIESSGDDEVSIAFT